MNLGPMSVLDLQSLTEKMDAMNKTYHVLVSIEDLQTAEGRLHAKVCRADQVTEGPWRYLYLQVAEANVPAIRDELQKRGLWIDRPEQAQDLFSPEYFCPKCDRRSDQPGRCSEHNETLLEYSDWVAAKNMDQSRAWRYLGVLSVVIFIAIILYSATNQIGLFPSFQPLMKW